MKIFYLDGIMLPDSFIIMKKKLVHHVITCCCLFVTLSGKAQTILLKAGKVYDPQKSAFLVNHEVLIEGGKIKAIGQQLPAPAGTQVIELPGATVTPGLIDAHTHVLLEQRMSDNLAADAFLNSSERRVLRAAKFTRAYLESGFTSIRDLGNSGQYLDAEVATAINRGYITGPHMQFSGPILSAMDGQFYQLPYKERDKITQAEYRVIKGKEDAVQAVKEHVNSMVSVIKIVAFGERMGLSVPEMKAIVRTAHDNHLKVTAHANASWIIAGALEAGVDGIEHGYYIEDSLLKRMAKNNVYLVPTDISLNGAVNLQKASNVQVFDTAAILKELSPLGERLKRARKAGVMIVMGSDAYIEQPATRGDAAKETLAAYVEEGLTVPEALNAATINAASALGRKGQLGIMQAGAQADITVFNGDLEKAFNKTLFDVNMVIKGGKIVYRK